MAECNVVVCDNHNGKSKIILDKWFDNYSRSVAKRDQMHMAYTLWELGIPVREVATLPRNARINGFFHMGDSSKHGKYLR